MDIINDMRKNFVAGTEWEQPDNTYKVDEVKNNEIKES